MMDRLEKITRAFSLTLALALPLVACASDADERMQFADGLYVRGMYDMALSEYQDLEKEAASDVSDLLLFRMAECHRKLDDAKSADACYRRLAASFPDSSLRFKAELRRAELFLAADRFAQAAALLDGLLGQGPSADVVAPAHYYLGYVERRMAEQLGAKSANAHLDKAEKALRRVVEEFSESRFVSYACLELAGTRSERGGTAEEIMRLYKQARKVAATDRVAAEALFQLAEYAYAQGAYTDSVMAYDELISDYPADGRVAEARLQAAWSYLNVGRLEDALALALPGVRETSEDEKSAWLYLRANCERALDRPEKAEQTYAKLLERHPESPQASAAAYEKALIAFREGNFEEVVQATAQLEGAGAGEADVHWLLAESYASIGQVERAREHYEAVRDDPRAGVRQAMALYQLAHLEQKAGRFGAASALYRELVKLDPDHDLASEALLASAYCRGQAMEHQEALRDWTQFVKDHKNHAKREQALHQKALLEVRLEKKAKARKTLRLLLKEFPKSEHAAEAYELLGILAEQDEQWAKAESALRLALDVRPEDQLADRVRFRLATVLQKQEKLDEAADLLDSVLASMQAAFPPFLLEWLARFRLAAGAYTEAVRAAEVLAETAAQPSWRQIGCFLAGAAHDAAGNKAAAHQAFLQALDVEAGTREGAEAALALGRQALDGTGVEAIAFFERAGELAQVAELIDLRAQSYYGLGLAADVAGDSAGAARYFMSVAVLFDDPELAAEALARAADAFERLDRLGERDQALQELKTRYPDSTWAKKSNPEPRTTN